MKVEKTLLTKEWLMEANNNVKSNVKVEWRVEYHVEAWVEMPIKSGRM